MTEAQTKALAAALKLVRIERDQARADARILAHAYTTDNRPPTGVVERALAYPVRSGG